MVIHVHWYYILKYDRAPCLTFKNESDHGTSKYKYIC